MAAQPISHDGQTSWACGAPYTAPCLGRVDREKAHRHSSPWEAEHCATLHELIAELAEMALAEGVDPDGVYHLLQAVDAL